MTIWVVERRVRRKGAKWVPYDTGGSGSPMSFGTAKMRMEYFADHLPHAFRIAKYRRAT